MVDKDAENRAHSGEQDHQRNERCKEHFTNENKEKKEIHFEDVIRINTSTKSWKYFLMKRKRNTFSNLPKREPSYLITLMSKESLHLKRKMKCLSCKNN